MTELKGLDEIAVRSIIGKLQAGWQNRANEINGAYADQIQISPPATESFFMGRMKPTNYPACFVLPGPAVFHEEGAHSMLTTFPIYVWVCDRDINGQQLAIRLMRQTRAIIEVLYDDPPQEAAYMPGTSIFGPYHIFPQKTTPGAVFQPSGQDSWVGSYMTTFTAEQEEL